MSYDKIPSAATLSPSIFESDIPDKAVSELRQLIELSPIGPETYENTTRNDGQYGISRKWLMDAKQHWLNNWDWRKTEQHINEYNNYVVHIKARDGDTYKIHFVGLFSNKANAVPVCLMHGWPGSFLEFLEYLNVVKKKYSPDDLPYHFIVPSLPGYAYSEGPSVKKEWNNEEIAYVMNELMVGLGFGNGYIAHGGDIGSFISRILAVRYDNCKAMQTNFCLMAERPKGVSESDETEQEKKGLQRLQEFGTTGNAYAREHGTKGGTIGLVLSSSPLALLAWIGEKFIAWSDQTPPLDEILDSVSLYWLTQSFPRAIYPYIDFFGRGPQSTVFHPHLDYYCKKPFGYSYFPMELGPIPISWAKATGDLVWHRVHNSGGHFAAMEKPKELFQDMEDFVEVLNWK